MIPENVTFWGKILASVVEVDVFDIVYQVIASQSESEPPSLIV